jgi:Ser-tRNA(Ala) deacylase AlaX
MTHKLFWSAPYQTELDTTISAVDGDRVQVAQTIFFAFSGGQESDAGTIGGHPVLQAEKRDQTIVYTLPAGHGLQVGDAVHLQIDWARRYRLMRLHFAAEMVLQLVYQMRPGIERIGAHIAIDKARVDFASETSLAPLFPAIEAAAQELVAAGLPIVTAFSDEAPIPAPRRRWERCGSSARTRDAARSVSRSCSMRPEPCLQCGDLNPLFRSCSHTSSAAR